MKEIRKDVGRYDDEYFQERVCNDCCAGLRNTRTSKALNIGTVGTGWALLGAGKAFLRECNTSSRENTIREREDDEIVKYGWSGILSVSA
jgi:hypothetical protein